MKAAVVSLLRGAQWLLEGWRMFRVAPFVWLGLVFTYWMMMAMLGLVPKLGVVVGVALFPAFSVGFMAVSRSCARNRPPEMGELFAGFREALPVQLVLGAVYFMLLAAVLWATTLADDGALLRWLTTGERPADEVLLSPEFRNALVVAAAGYAPVMMLYWFAPVLVAWHGMGGPKALFFSFAACLVNWRAFTGYGIAAALLTIVLPFLVMSVLLILSGGKLRGAVMALVLPLVLVLLPVLYASFYASYRDVFGNAAPAPGEPVPQ